LLKVILALNSGTVEAVRKRHIEREREREGSEGSAKREENKEHKNTRETKAGRLG
jgi:hypothetical protein